MSKVITHSQTRKRIFIPWHIAILATSTPTILRHGTLSFLKHYCIPSSLITIFVESKNDYDKYKAQLSKGSYGTICTSSTSSTTLGIGGLLTTVYSYYKVGAPLIICRDSITEMIEYCPGSPTKAQKVGNFIKCMETLFQTCQKEGSMLWGLYHIANGLYLQPTIIKTLKWISGGLWGCFNPGDVFGKIQLKTENCPEFEVVLQNWKLFKTMVRWNGLSVIWNRPKQCDTELKKLAEEYPKLVKLEEKNGHINLIIQSNDRG